MTGKHCDRVPIKGTVIDMNLQRLHLSQQHVGEVFAQQEDTCLLTDETSKKGEKYMGYEASDSTGRLWVLGVRDMATKSAADTLSVFKEILNDIDYTSEQSSDQTSKLILKHIVATMSDRAATEIKFNTLLQDYKTTIMPAIIENLDTMPEDEQKSVSHLANFFCGLHALIHIAETAEKAIRGVEQGLLST